MLSPEQTLSGLAYETGLTIPFFNVVDLLKQLNASIDFGASVALSPKVQSAQEIEEVPLRRALVEEALSGHVYPWGFFSPDNAERLLRMDPLFFSPSGGTDLLTFLGRVSVTEGGLGFTNPYRTPENSDAWVLTVLKNTDQALESHDRLLGLAGLLVELNCSSALTWLCSTYPALTSMQDAAGKFWVAAKAPRASGWVWDTLLEVGVDPFAPQNTAGTPLWRTLVPKKTTVSVPEKGSMRERIEGWLRENRCTMPFEQRVAAESYLIEVGLRCLSPSASADDQHRKIGPMQAHLNSLPAQWVNHVVPGRGMPASLALLSRVVPNQSRNQPADKEGLQWAMAIDKNPVWREALSPYCGLCINVFLALYKKKDLMKEPLPPEQLALVQHPQVHGFFVEVEKKLGAAVPLLLTQLKSQWLDRTLPAPSATASKPRF